MGCLESSQVKSYPHRIPKHDSSQLSCSSLSIRYGFRTAVHIVNQTFAGCRAVFDAESAAIVAVEQVCDARDAEPLFRRQIPSLSPSPGLGPPAAGDRMLKSYKSSRPNGVCEKSGPGGDGQMKSLAGRGHRRHARRAAPLRDAFRDIS